MSSGLDEFPGQCGNWSLTKAQAERFFRLSKPVDARTYVHDYDTSRCMVTGRLMHAGTSWDLTINGGAKGYWSRKGEVRYFGCVSSGCEKLSAFMQEPEISCGCRQASATLTKTRE